MNTIISVTRADTLRALLEADPNLPAGREAALKAARADASEPNLHLSEFVRRRDIYMKLLTTPAPNPQTHMQRAIRSALYNLLRDKASPKQALLLGFTVDQLKALHNPGSWADLTSFTVTFATPLSKYDLTNPEQVALATDITNITILDPTTAEHRRLAARAEPRKGRARPRLTDIQTIKAETYNMEQLGLAARNYDHKMLLQEHRIEQAEKMQEQKAQLRKASSEELLAKLEPLLPDLLQTLQKLSEDQLDLIAQAIITLQAAKDAPL